MTAQLIHRLTASCYLPEFTDHGLSHVCSLVERISTWTCEQGTEASQLLVERLSADERATLLMAVLFHDIGMLSQRPDDLPPSAGFQVLHRNKRTTMNRPMLALLVYF